MLAIFTNSFDATTDLIVQHIDKSSAIFRFNSDLIKDYSLSWQPGRWEIVNLITHESIHSDNISSAYWRKPLEMISGALPGYPESFYSSEIRYAFREIVNSISRRKKFRLVEPFAERRVGKFYQLEVASQYFAIPETLFTLNTPRPHCIQSLKGVGDVVAKSVSGAEVSANSVMYTSRIDTASIDNEKPWFIQAWANGDHDVTCAYVTGQCYWAKRSRKNMGELVDVREAQGATNDWDSYISDSKTEDLIRKLMDELNLSFGRIDFLEYEGRLTFLEVNPNGQYAWIDINNKQGLISRVSEEILK